MLLTELATRPASEQVEFIEALDGLQILTERDRDALRKRAKRAESARIEIPECRNVARREACLADPERFLKTYFAARYSRDFGKLHHAMIEAMLEIANHGGKQAIAAPRGRGKSEITRGMLCYLMCASMIHFPVVVCQTTKDAARTYRDFRKKIQNNELLYEDFPEICHPVRDLESAPQKAARQHIDDKLTGIEWTQESLRLANVPEQYRIGQDFGGFRMEFRGLDAAIRGLNSEGDRPDFVIIDDPETKESAKSETQIADREQAIEQDIAGLAGEDEELAQLMLTTIQNSYCLSFKYTDPDQKPSWMGRRFAWVETWPDEWNKGGVDGDGLWCDYIALRHKDQREGDRYGRTATQFYLDNREAMEAGGELLADNFRSKVLSDGWQTVHSAWQSVFNEIADTSYEAFCTEYQNDPPQTEQIEQIQLTAAKVQARLANTGQREVPGDTGYETIGIDLGKHYSNWTHTTWTEETCVGTIPDYGVMETHGLNAASDRMAVEHALVSALEVWAEEIVDPIKPQLVLIDSGNWAEAVYNFCRNAGPPFFPCKGWDSGRFRMPKEPTAYALPYLECHASYLSAQNLWLYHMNGEYWKTWLQNRFLQRTFGDDGERQPGSLALFDPVGDSKRHLSFSKHIMAEYERFIPKEGKLLKRDWHVDNRNNHWLDATAMACSAAGCLGVRLMAEPPPPPKKPPPPPDDTKEARATPYSRDGLPFVAIR